MKKVKKRFLIPAILLVLFVIGFMFLRSIGKPLSRNEVKVEIKNILEKAVEKNDITSVILTIHSDKKAFSETFTAGTIGNENNKVEKDQPYLAASVTKTFTAAAFGILYDKKIIRYTDKISKYLDESLLENLFVFEGVDYKNDVTIGQLLDHTSGIGDYWEDNVNSGKTFRELLLSKPEHFWKPYDLISFTRENQVAVGRPGGQMHYSDTGYQLLGLLIESITNETFEDFIHNNILNPLQLNDTYMIHYSEPKNKKSKEIAEVWMGGKDLSKKNFLSVCWSDGGLVSTTADLLTFYKALNCGEVVSKDVLNRMTNFKSKYRDGVFYGSGMMEFRFGDFSPMLSGMPNIYGGVGASASFMMYDEVNDTYIVGNFGSIDFMDGSVGELIKILLVYSRMVI